MSRISGESTARSIDRRQWSNLDSVSHDLLLNGHGEGYVEEVYFGKGFSTPPTFTFSATFHTEEEVVIPRYLTSPRGSLTRTVDEYGIGNDTQSHGGYMEDPGFESQAKYHLLPGVEQAAITIPTVNWYSNAYVDILYGNPASWDDAFFPVRKAMYDLQQAEVDWEDATNNTWSSKFREINDFDIVFGPHRWIQTNDTQNMWSLDLTESHDLGVGEAGQASATATIGPNGYTNWLIPFRVAFDYNTSELVFDTIDTPEHQWRAFRTSFEGANNTVSTNRGGGISAQAYPPPYLGGFVGMMYVKSESEVEVQVNATLSESFAEPGETGGAATYGTVIFDDTHFSYSRPEFNIGFDHDYSADYSYIELGSTDFNHVYNGSGWGRVDVHLPYDGLRAWPNAYQCLYRDFLPAETYWTLRFRVKGTPGAQVWLDNIYMDVEQRNSGIPILTVGVDEWIRDEAGVYIGAKLWIVSGTPTGDLCNRLET